MPRQNTDPLLSQFLGVLKILSIAAIYFIAAKFGLSLAYTTPQVTAVWPATGISIAVLLLFGWRMWPGILIGAFVVNAVSQEPLPVALGIAIGNTLEAVVANFALRMFMNFRNSLERVRDIYGIFMVAMFFAAPISATIGVMSLVAGRLIPPAGWDGVWFTWWIGDMMGAIIITPLILILSQKASYSLVRRRLPEFLLLLAAFLIGSIIFTVPYHANAIIPTLKYLAIPFVIVMAFRFRQFGAATATFLVSSALVWNTIHDRGPFALPGHPEQNLFLMQLFLFVIAVTAYLIAAILSEREQEHATTDALLLSIGDGLIVTDRDGRIIRVNQPLEDMLAFSREQLLGRLMTEVIQAVNDQSRPIPDSRRIPATVFANNRPMKRQGNWVRRDGLIVPVAITAAPVWTAGKLTGCMIVVRDVTEEKRVDRAKSEFVSLASHQLRTPLTAMRWYLELLVKEGKELSPEHRQRLYEIHHSALSMIELVNTLLNVTRLELGNMQNRPEPTKLEDLVTSVIRDVDRELKQKNLQLTFTSEPRLPVLYLDPQLMSIVVSNLISNAVKYTPPGGLIEITLSRTRHHVRLVVRDNGYGIPKADQDRIFTRMFRAENVKKIDTSGTGIGLYLVKSVAQTTGCDISFQSQKGKGSEFTYTIPLPLSRLKR